MVTIGIIILIGVLYLLGWFSAAFWIIVLAIANGAFAMVHATTNPEWYWRKQMEAGIEPGRLGLLYLHKAIPNFDFSVRGLARRRTCRVFLIGPIELRQY